MPNNPCVRIAHRGASADYPENTLLAFERAIAHGVDMLELDLQLTRDGELVVIHDETLERTTNGAGLVRDQPLADIQRLDAGRGQRVPLLAEVVELVRPTAVRLCVEVKGETVADSLAITEATVAALERADMLGRVVVTSFIGPALLHAKALRPDIATLLDPSPQNGSLTPRQICQQTLAAGANCISYDVRFLTQAIVDEARFSGLALWPWAPNEADDIRRVLGMGVPGIMTDRPDVLNAVLAELFGPTF
jgi:glycerophosphoryl diester phosphodiesterase